MYTILLSAHSVVRWFILVVFIYAIIRAFYGWIQKKEFGKADKITLLVTASLAHLQLVLGLWLYFVSPLVHFFLNNFHVAVKIKEFRFLGMEHALMMLIAIIFITIGSSVAKRKKTDIAKFKTIAIWYSLALVLIVAGIPYR